MDADAKFDAALRRQARVALDHAVLHFDRAAHGVDHAAKFDQAAVAGALDDAPMMGGDGGVDQIAAQPPQPRQGAILVRAREPAIADDVRDQNRRDFPGLAHGATPWGHSVNSVRSFGLRKVAPSLGAPDFKQRLRLGDLRHFGRWRKAFDARARGRRAPRRGGRSIGRAWRATATRRGRSCVRPARSRRRSPS